LKFECHFPSWLHPLLLDDKQWVFWQRPEWKNKQRKIEKSKEKKNKKNKEN
jgi:hypothetical protein